MDFFANICLKKIIKIIYRLYRLYSADFCCCEFIISFTSKYVLLRERDSHVFQSIIYQHTSLNTSCFNCFGSSVSMLRHFLEVITNLRGALFVCTSTNTIIVSNIRLYSTSVCESYEILLSRQIQGDRMPINKKEAVINGLVFLVFISSAVVWSLPLQKDIVHNHLS